jgi:hypothetical protein
VVVGKSKASPIVYKAVIKARLLRGITGDDLATRDKKTYGHSEGIGLLDTLASF